ncbi:MAG: iron ABC transporter permease [Planctomycetota bacterium]
MKRARLLVAIPAIAVLGAVVAPLVWAGVGALRGDVGSRWARLNGVILDRMVNSFVLGIGCALVSTLFGLALVWAVHRREFFGRRLLGAIYVAPLLVPPHIHTVSWMRVFGRQGYLSNWLHDHWGWQFDIRRGFVDVGGAPVFFPGTMMIMVSAFWPLAALVISAGFRQIAPRQEEAAIVAVGRRRAFRGVTLPLLAPHLWTAGFFVFIFAITCYGVPALLDTPTIMLEVFFTSANVDPLAAWVIAIPLVATTVAALLFVLLGGGRRVWEGRSLDPGRVTSAMRPRSATAGILAWGILLVTAGWPLASLLHKAGGPETYRAIWNNVLPQVKASLILAVVAGITIAAAGLLVAGFANALGRRRGFLVEVLALLPFAFPAVVVALSLNEMWGSLSALRPDGLLDRWVYRGMGLPLIAYLALFLPFGVRGVRATMTRLSPRPEEAAMVAGRGSLATFTSVTLPRLAPGILAAFVLGYILTLGELVAGLMVNTDRWQTAQARVFNMIHFSRDEEVAALCVMIALLALVPTAIYAVAFNRRVEVL